MKTFKTKFYGKDLIVEIGEVAKQADSSCIVRYDDTVILTTVVVGKDDKVLQDFLPLMVVYQEKLYSVGKIPGGFIKREGRASDNATLASRMIDRPIRPLIQEDFRRDIQIVNTVLSVEQDASPELAALIGSSVALSLSGVPFMGPVAAVKVGLVDDELIINPSIEEQEKSILDLTVAGTKDAINMVEASSKEVEEDIMLDALFKGHDAVIELNEFIESIIDDIKPVMIEYDTLSVSDDLKEVVRDYLKDDLKDVITSEDKLVKWDKTLELMDNMYEKFIDEDAEVDEDKQRVILKSIFDEVQEEVFRSLILKDEKRPDGRDFKEIRPLSCRIDFLPRTHGSAIFSRGETQSLGVTTLGAINEHQILDGIGLEDEKRFMLHYNFPSFSVGETGRYGYPGRREIGHGALGERALSQVIPSQEDFPYTIRVVSEILESNGSSSQASICSATLSLMAAGVPIKAPVAGIAMGLVSDNKKYKILTDIQGLEDHLGDMDFKVAGTSKGICALQMDIKIKGIDKKILKEALNDAKDARLNILDVMLDVIDEPREDVSKYAPKMEKFYIDPAKIKDVIGKGGEVITAIISEESNVESVNDVNAVKIDIDDNGLVIIYHMDRDIINKVKARIENIVKVPEEGKLYEGKVTRVESFGCFVELWPGCEGLVHISKLSKERVKEVSDVVKVGDIIVVKSLGLNKKGQLDLSRKDV